MERVCPFCAHKWRPRIEGARQCPACKKVVPAPGAETRMGWTFNWTFTLSELREFAKDLDADKIRALFPRGVGGPVSEDPAGQVVDARAGPGRVKLES
jgi:hypothetical protein